MNKWVLTYYCKSKWDTIITIYNDNNDYNYTMITIIENKQKLGSKNEYLI